MSKRLSRIAPVGVVLGLIVVAGAAAMPETLRLGKPKTVVVGNLRFTDNGWISPTKLPRHEQAPIAAHINGSIGTTDGSHPPAIGGVVADFDKDIQVNARGLPACAKSKLTARSTAAARKACPDAIVGSGEGAVEVAFPEQRPFSAESPILLFNGGVRGGTTLLLIHAYVSVPAPTAVVATVRLTRVQRGRYGLHAVAEIPRIAGGAGSVTEFKFVIDRKFTYRGKTASYLTASCPAGRYHADGNVLFTDGTRLSVTHVLPCTPRG